MPTLAIALKDLRLLLRDPRAAVILLLMPLVLILILGLTLGEAFGRKPDHTLRISVVVEDRGLPTVPGRRFPPKPWSDVFLDDLADTGDIRVERIATRAEAQRLVDRGDRAAVVVLGLDFSDRADHCSFVGGDFKRDPINPLHRYGVATDRLDVAFLENKTQPVGAAVIRQVVQVSLLRVVIPWMIGQAFDLIGTDPFMDRMEKHIPELRLAYPFLSKKRLGEGIRNGISAFFGSYDFHALNWADLTKDARPEARTENRAAYQPPGLGLGRGTARYQILVPAYTVTFAFFLVLTVGWLFVAERRHGTMARLRAAPLARWQILAGKLLPCLLVSLIQGFFLLACGKLVFGMSWGSQPWLLVPVVASTSLAAVGLAMLVAGMARTETQVAVYGTLLVLVLAGVSGSMLPREMMPDDMRRVSYVTPHAWALDAYAQLLNPENPTPDGGAVLTACGALVGFGVGFLLLAWWRMRLD
jgi:ABC-type transport system involved in cytochrome c biogenesis permease component